MRRIVILAASPRLKSNSLSISEYLKIGLDQEGAKADIINFAGRWEMKGLAEEIREYDMVILVSPLYHDTISFSATAVLEELIRSDLGKKDFSIIVHSGYPEAVHRAIAVDICACFAEKMGWKNLGYLSPGLTSVIAGKDLIAAGDMFKNLRIVLDEAASLWAEGMTVGEKLSWHSRISPMPPFLLRIIGNISIRKDAKRKGLDVMRRPYM